jgi:predicted transcriptional regulator
MAATARTTVLLDADLLERLGRYATRSRTTKTAVIAAALEAYLAEHEAATEVAFLAVGQSAHGRLSLDGRRIAGREAGRRPGGGR